MAIPTAAEREARRQAQQQKAPAPLPTPLPPEGRRQQIKERQVASELQEQQIAADEGEDELYSQLLAEVKRENMLLTPEAAREAAKERLAQIRPGPYYVGGFKPVEFKSAAGVLPAARPQDLPASPKKPVTFLEALAPQTRAGERAVDKFKRERTASIFDDGAFNETIKDLPDADKREQLDMYEASKAAFKKLRDLNPLETTGVTDADLIRDINRQIKALNEGDIKTFVDDPANRMGYGGDPLARALQKQVTKGAPVPILEPGQTEFVSTLDRLKRSRSTAAAATEAEARLRSQGVPVMKKVRKPTGERGPGGRSVTEEVEVPTGQYRPATPEDIKRARESVAAFTDREMPKPLYAEIGKLDQFLSANEKAAKGGLIFQKELPTGATVESPVSWFVRSALSVPNALVGVTSEVFTPEEITKRERAARPELYKDTSAAIYNVAAGRGMMGEVGDLYEYAPESWTLPLTGKPLKEYTTYAKAAGFAGDLIGFDLGLIGGVVAGARAGAGAVKAARVTGEGFNVLSKAAIVPTAKAASKEFLSTIGLASAAKKVNLGDVRLQFGTSLGDSMRAGDAYKQALQNGKTEVEALSDAAAVAPKSKFVKDMQKSPITDVAKVETYFKDAEDEWQALQKVARGTETAKRGGAVADFAEAVRPYIAAAARATPELKPIFQAVARAEAASVQRVKLSKIIEEVNKLPSDAQARFYDTIRDTASAELGFTAIDRSIGALDPGRFTVRLTPNTFTSDDAIDSILEGVRQTGEYKLTQRITSRGTTGGKYAVVGGEKRGLTGVIQRQAATSTLPRSQVTRIIDDISSGAVSGDDLRLVMNSVIDTVAEQTGRAFKERALAARGTETVSRAGVPRGKIPVSGSRTETFGEGAGIFNTYWRRTATWLSNAVKGASSTTKFLSPQQVRILEDGKRKIGNLSRTLQDDLDKLPDTLSPFEKAVELAGDATRPDYWRRVAQSALFGTADRTAVDMLFGNFNYQDPFKFLNGDGRKALDVIANRYTGTAVTEGSVQRFIDDVDALVGNREFVNNSFLDGAGVVFNLRDKPIEVLAGVWARGKVDDIMSDTIARVVDFEPDTVGFTTLVFKQAFGNRKTADGVLLADMPINAIVAEKLLNQWGSRPIETIPLIKKFIDEADAINPGVDLGKRIILTNLIDLVADADNTAALLVGKYGSGSGEIIAAEARALASGDATLAELGGPLGTVLGKAIREDFGRTANWNAYLSEMGALAELEARGNRTAFAGRRALSFGLDTYNSLFYNMILYVNPRYHGTNIVTGPFIGYTTTGKIPGLRSIGDGARTIMQGTNPAARSAVIATDQATGVPITIGELYDRTIGSGVFKSEAMANIDPRFLEDARKLGLATGTVDAANVARKIRDVPASFANASDNVWRMSYVIDAIKSGKSVDEALEVGRRSLYDYGSATPFERKYVAKNIMFYNFFRNSVLETARQAVTTPARLARQARLVQDYSKLQVGEEKWNELRFYTPYDAGVSRMVLGFAPQAGREGSITLFPNLSWYDAVYITSGLLTTPMNLLMGAADPVTGKREYGSGYIYQKLSPSAQALISIPSGADMLADVRMTKDQLPVQHAALFDELGQLDSITKMFNLKKIPAEGGQTGWNGYVYTMKPEDFESYKVYIKAAKVVGAQRPIDDFAKWFATWDIDSDIDQVTGPSETATFTPAEAAGALLDTRAGVPAEAELEAAKTRARQLKEDVKTATPTSAELKARRPQ
jgi:hypothetical protein